jgi:hypothetical protein
LPVVKDPVALERYSPLLTVVNVALVADIAEK